MAAEFIDPRCLFYVEFTRESREEVKKMLDPPNILTGLGCRVVKHPDCCVLCAANEACERLPMHFRCRCKPEGYLELEE